MKIESIHIENFGPHIDLTLGEGQLSSGLTVVHGPNEAGKSAIRAFIRMVLFGRMNARSTGATKFNYTHATTGPGAGSLSILAEDGKKFTVQRTERRPPVVSGNEGGGQELLTAILGRIDETLYQNVFSISLSELESIDTLGADQIRDRIYSAGLGLGEVSLPDAMKRLEGERSSPSGLWSPSAGLLRKNLTAMAQERRDLRDAAARASGYEDLSVGIEEVESLIGGLDLELSKSRTTAARLKLVNELRPVAARKKLLEEQIARFRQTNGFPPDGLDQLNELTADLVGSTQQLSAVELRLKSRTEELQTVEPHSAVGEYEVEIRGILSRQQSYEDAARDLSDVKAQLDAEREGLVSGLESLGDGWSTATLDSFVDFEGARVRITSTQAERDHATSVASAALGNLETIKSAQEKVRRDLEDVVRRKDALTDVPGLIEMELRDRDAKLESLRLALIDGRSAPTSASTSPGPLSNPVVAIAAAAVGAVLIALSIGLGEVIGVAGGAGLIAIAGYLFTRKTSLSVIDTAANVNSEIQRLLNDLNLEDDTSERRVVELQSANRIDIERRSDFERYELQRADLSADLGRADAEIEAATEVVSSNARGLDEGEADWRALMIELGFSDRFDRAQALASVERVERLKLREANVMDFERRVTAISTTIEDVELALSPLTAALGLPPASTGQAGGAIAQLSAVFESYVANSATSRAIKNAIRELSESIKTLETQITALEQKETHLFEIAKCSSPEEFRSIARELQARVIAERSLADLVADQPAVNESGPNSILEEISMRAHEEITAELAAAEDRIGLLDTDRGAQREILGALRNQKKELEKSNPTAPHELKIDELEQAIEEQAHRWAVLSVAHHAILSTRERYQRERQAPLMQHATDYFKYLTSGGYTRIETVLGEDEIRVFDEHDVAKTVDELSRGTAEQLYLAIRFALIKEYCEHSEPLPLVMDDVTVNFDEKRARSAFESITRLSGTHQILSLTCHESTVEGFMKSAEDTGAPPPAIVRL